jgi:hypothetical protein
MLTLRRSPRQRENQANLPRQTLRADQGDPKRQQGFIDATQGTILNLKLTDGSSTSVPVQPAGIWTALKITAARPCGRG